MKLRMKKKIKEVKDENEDNEPFEEFGVKIQAETDPIVQRGAFVDIYVISG